MAEQKLTGKISRERVRLTEAPRPPAGIIEGFRALGDASGIVSDVMDELGITGIIGASALKPTIVGPALTVRNIMQREHVYEAARRQKRQAMGHARSLNNYEPKAGNCPKTGGGSP